MAKYLKVAEAFILSILAIFAPIKAMLITTGIMILADLITGVIAARRRNEEITSAGLRRSITKLVVYEAALMLAYLAEHYLSDILPFVKMASALIAVVELKSIYENLNSASGMNLLKELIDKLGSKNDDQSPK